MQGHEEMTKETQWPQLLGLPDSICFGFSELFRVRGWSSFYDFPAGVEFLLLYDFPAGVEECPRTVTERRAYSPTVLSWRPNGLL